MTSDGPPDASDTAALVANDPDFDLYVRQQAKRALREKMRALRASVPAESRHKRSQGIVAHLLALPELASATTVLTFLPIKGEPTLDALHDALRARGATLALTRVDAETDTLEVARFDDEASLVWGSYGLREPPPDATPVALDVVDVVLVPGLVMDLRGHRIGYGKGHFDRLLLRLPTAFRVGVCYDFQLVGEAPCLPHDVPLHAVVTDQQVVRPDPLAP